MPALAQRAGTKNQLINYDFGQETHKELTPGVHIHMSYSMEGRLPSKVVSSSELPLNCPQATPEVNQAI